MFFYLMKSRVVTSFAGLLEYDKMLFWIIICEDKAWFCFDRWIFDKVKYSICEGSLIFLNIAVDWIVD